MIMSYYDHFLNLSTGVIICVHTTSQEVSVTKYRVKRKDCAVTFYTVPGFVAVLEIPVI